MIEAILFDFNGIIIDDELLQLQAYRQVLNDFGIVLTERAYYEALGKDDRAFVRTQFARESRTVDEDNLESIIERKTELHRKLIESELPLFPGVVTFIKEAARRYMLGLVSMARRIEIDYVIERAGLSSYFSVVLSAENVTQHKPAPESYQRALELLNQRRRNERKLPLLAHECLVIEDAPAGIEAARAAGTRSIGVTSTVSESYLRAAGANIVTTSLADWNVDAVHLLFDYAVSEPGAIATGSSNEHAPWEIPKTRFP